ncbi:hypothetical protein [Sulfobacillus thermosulfidooxidans]|uniref:hypothetical protein n=1 Tax=Sulfobacillus thermosulfidooxidans TaxID=28034 RepID=UPI0006B5D8FC|nr:hypothetical protein [Sulfobacillus thermosulfidooxidans]
MSTARLVPTTTSREDNVARAHSKSHLLGSLKLMALGLWLIYMSLGVYLTVHLHYYAGDAVSRVANAYYVLFGRNPHLGAIGFIWNPLPSLFELPLITLYPLFPAIVTKGLAGICVSALFAAWGAVHLHRILVNFAVPKPWNYVITLIFALNPLIVLYGANGMSDIMLLSCLLGTYSGVLDFLSTHALSRLVSAGIWLALALGMRYEAVPFGTLMILSLMMAQWKTIKTAMWAGSAIILGAPVVFSGGLWIYFNWAIMKNPLYFLNSNYGNLAQTRTGAYLTPALEHAYHNVAGTIEYVAHFLLLSWPLGIAAATIIIFFLRGKHADSKAIILLCGALGAILLEIAFAYLGHLGSWDRYFISFIADSALMVSFVASKIAQRFVQRKGLTNLWWTLITIILLSANVGTYLASQNPVIGHPDGAIMDYALQNRSMQHVSNPFTLTDTVIHYLNRHPHMTVLADAFNAWPIIIRSKNFNRFIITSDYDFASILHNPKGRVTAILVPEPSGVAALDAVNRVWPQMWAGHVPWVTLLKAFPGGGNWRLYEVTPQAP